jgi:predicted Zn finger-like uncharacterized protein
MLIVCPSCATSYDVDVASLSPNGRQVRCVRCRTVWQAELSHADKLAAAAAALAPDPDTADMPDPAPVAVASVATAPAAAAAVQAPKAAAASGPGRASGRRAGQGEDADHVPTDGAWQAPAAAEDDPAPAEIDTVAEAESEPVDAPPIAPEHGHDGELPAAEVDDAAVPLSEVPAPELAEDIESVAARRQRLMDRRGLLRWPFSPLATGILALALIDVILVGWRNDIVRALPQTASFYARLGLPVNLRGLSFDEVAMSTEQHEGVPILVVEGYVFNGAHRVEDVPRLKFILRNAARQEIYSWTAVPARGSLPPGEAVAFRTRLASPPPDAHDLVLRFVNRGDMYAGMR